MSIVIKGMEMPKHCLDCVLKNDDDDCMAQKWKEWKDWEDMREGCPLVELPEKHGRLIDGDELITAFPECDNNMDIKIASVRATVNHMLTVIEAEGEG